MLKVPASLRDENPQRTFKRLIKCFHSPLPIEQEKLLLFRTYNPSHSMKFGAIGQESVTVIDTLIHKSWEKIITLSQVPGPLLISYDLE